MLVPLDEFAGEFLDHVAADLGRQFCGRGRVGAVMREHLLVMRGAGGALGGAGFAGVGGAEGARELAIEAGFLFRASSSEGERAGAGKLAIEERESLRRYRRGVALFAGSLAAGLVENLQQRIAQRAQAEGVERAPVALARRARGQHRGCRAAHDVARLERGFPIDLREDAGPAEFRIQLAGDGEQRVADFLRGEAARGEVGE